MKSGSGGCATGSGGSTTVASVPSSIRPSITPAETPASRAARSCRAPCRRREDRAPARRRQALGRRARKPHADALAFGAEMLAHAQAHAQHHAAGGQRVIRDPFDKPAQFRLERRELEPLLDVLEPIIEPRIRVGVLGPHHAGGLARPERHGDDVAGRKLKHRRHAVGIGPVQRAPVLPAWPPPRRSGLA